MNAYNKQQLQRQECNVQSGSSRRFKVCLAYGNHNYGTILTGEQQHAAGGDGGQKKADMREIILACTFSNIEEAPF